MKSLFIYVFALAVVAVPAVYLVAPSDEPTASKKQVKSVPAPPAVLLLGVAAGVVGVRKLWQNRR